MRWAASSLEPRATYLRPRTPKSHHWVYPAGGQQAGGGMRLEAIDDGVVSFEHLHDVRRVPVPDEKGAVVWSSDYVLALAAKIGF